MKTKCIVLSQQEKKLKPIEFINYIDKTYKFCKSQTNPNEYANIELICKEYTCHGQDLMFAFDENRDAGILYIGHWNDGVVNE